MYVRDNRIKRPSMRGSGYDVPKIITPSSDTGLELGMESYKRYWG